MPRYWLEYTRVGHAQPIRRPVELPRAEALAYFEGFRAGSCSAERKRFRLLDEHHRVIAGAEMRGTAPRERATPGVLGLD